MPTKVEESLSLSSTIHQLPVCANRMTLWLRNFGETAREFFQGKNEEVKRGHEIIFFQLGTLSSKVNISTYYLSTSKALFGAEDEKIHLISKSIYIYFAHTIM